MDYYLANVARYINVYTSILKKSLMEREIFFTWNKGIIIPMSSTDPCCQKLTGKTTWVLSCEGIRQQKQRCHWVSRRQ